MCLQERNIDPGDEDSSIRLFGVRGTEENGKTIIEFTRDLDGGTMPIDVANGLVSVNLAIGGEDALVQHGFGSSNRNSFAIDFLSGDSENEGVDLDKYYKWHGALMIISWIGIIPTGGMLLKLNAASRALSV